MNSIGGYFELELSQRKEYHQNAIRLNTGRNAFEYVLRAKNYNKVYLPYYTCDVMLEPINKLSLEYEFYHIDEIFRPVFDFTCVQPNEVFIYNNYFGICDIQVKEVNSKCNNLLIDNSQSFFSEPLPNVDTFYSVRKFFGLPDGAYLYSNKLFDYGNEQDISYSRFEHLLGRIDINAEKFYPAFKKNELSLIGQSIKTMSPLTRRILESVDYDKTMTKRHENFIFLHNELLGTNQLHINIEDQSVPMVYPYLVEKGLEIKKKLLDRKIFVACFWPNVTKWVEKESIEDKYVNLILPLPIDQRLGKMEMKYIINCLKNL